MNIIIDFLSFKKQQFVLNAQASPWTSIQGSILVPLLFLVYINDLYNDLSTTAKPDDTSIYFNNKSVKQVPSQKHLEMILDTKLNFQEHLKIIKLLGYYGNCKTPCHADNY